MVTAHQASERFLMCAKDPMQNGPWLNP